MERVITQCPSKQYTLYKGDIVRFCKTLMNEGQNGGGIVQRDSTKDKSENKNKNKNKKCNAVKVPRGMLETLI